MHFAVFTNNTLLSLTLSHAPHPKLKYSLNYQGDSKNANKTSGLIYKNYS